MIHHALLLVLASFVPDHPVDPVEIVACGTVSANEHEVGGSSGTSQGQATEAGAKDAALSAISLNFGKCASCPTDPPIFCTQLNFWDFPSPPDAVTHQNPDETWSAWVSVPPGTTLTVACRPCP